MNNNLAKKITIFSLLKFTAPTVIMMVFMSLYTMIDGVFVSRFVNTNALSAVNIVFPAFNVVLAIGIMLATGGSAVSATQMGQGKQDKAKQSFSLIVLTGVVIGFVLLVLGLVFPTQIVTLLGADADTFGYCMDYLQSIIWFVPFAILQMLFQYYFVTAGKPMIGLVITILGGVANTVLDYIFIVPLGMGISGAAIATGIGLSIPAIFGLVYFTVNRKGSLCFVVPKLRGKILLKACTNGSSEMVTNLSTAVTTFLFNMVMMQQLGSDGVAAITIILYSQYLLTSVFLGYSSGVAPLFSYNYGNQNKHQIKKLFKLSIIFMAASSAIAFVVAITLSNVLVGVFAQPGSAVFDIAINGFWLAALAFLVMGINIFSSAMFTAFSNGKVSAIISFLRTFVFIVAAIMLLPNIIGVNGVWLAVPVAELLTVFISAYYFIKYKKVYNY